MIKRQQEQAREESPKCEICNQVITKYKMDLGDTVQIYENKKWNFVCDRCAINIAEQLIHR